jgi:CheY-like chemotaxis protein
MVDPSQLQGAILNLALNARDAMPGGGKLTLAAENVLVDPDYARVHAEVRPGRYVLISVTDTGTGMDKETQERAFDPFFTTKEVGAGSGLGLSMVYGFVKQSQGHIQLYSEPGHGTTVRIYLPRADKSEPIAEHRDTAAMDLRSRGETVLVVEDEARVRRLTLMRLQELGYRTLEAANGPAALALLQNDAGVDLVFTDVIMPGGMTGADLAKHVLDRWPHIPVLFTSGYAEPDLVRQGLSNGARWLKKPYTSVDLARTVRQILDTAERRQG